MIPLRCVLWKLEAHVLVLSLVNKHHHQLDKVDTKKDYTLFEQITHIIHNTSHSVILREEFITRKFIRSRLQNI